MLARLTCRASFHVTTKDPNNGWIESVYILPLALPSPHHVEKKLVTTLCMYSVLSLSLFFPFLVFVLHKFFLRIACRLLPK